MGIKQHFATRFSDFAAVALEWLRKDIIWHISAIEIKEKDKEAFTPFSVGIEDKIWRDNKQHYLQELESEHVQCCRELGKIDMQEVENEISYTLSTLQGMELSRYVHRLITPFNYYITTLEQYADIWARLEEYNTSEGDNEEAYNFLLDLKDIFHEYICRLDGVLLYHHIDLMKVQQDCGVVLMRERSMNDLAWAVGSEVLAKKLVNDCQQAPEPQQEPILAERLKKDDAQKYFKKAIELKLMDENYKWLKGLEMLACFARDMSNKLNMGKGDRISWKPFEELFCIERGKLRLNYNDIQKTGRSPTESNLIDKVFE